MYVFKDFLKGEKYNKKGMNRLEQRYRHIVEPFKSDIAGGRVLDLACHDGRWSYALSFAGAKKVVGVEGRADVLDLFKAYPKSEITDRIELRCNDLFAELESEVKAGEKYDVVAIYGVFYHVVDHFRLLDLVRSLGPKLIIIDSEFVQRSRPMICLNKENTSHDLNAIAGKFGERFAATGTPTFSAMNLMAKSIGCSIEWVDWNDLAKDQRAGVKDYYEGVNRQKKSKMPFMVKRATCALRPN
ncbi:class I SAM-dependent methyltransferase [Ruegeria sp. 2205SS24-7]|uniref:class I SAM-dependent methyltransferase n=1 Tax=Ruegeria discodermiae TaxID=3064389 RepID=UPI0027412AD0|nr:class I SAM-dependent methyltransferase [Ruegeria sp. 2205SS24-7]MDP5216705.1 class I SAM-dependent methyltransferase [Ruegeria sp. 2205SS24-7]